MKDARAVAVTLLVTGSLAESVDRVLGFFGADLAADGRLRAAVLEHARELQSSARPRP